MSYFFIPVPITNPYTIIFPGDKNTKGFDVGAYNPALTDGRASNEEINQALKEIESVRRPFYKKMLVSISTYVFALIFGVIAYIGLTSYLNKNHSTFANYLIYPFIIYIFGSVVFFIMSIKKNRMNGRKAALEIVSKYNLIFASKGLRWHLPVHFPKWVELWKDYLGQPNPQTSFYTPPPEYGAPGQSFEATSHFQKPGGYEL